MSGTVPLSSSRCLNALLCVCLLTLSYQLQSIAGTIQGKLEAGVVIFRHGARSPLPSDLSAHSDPEINTYPGSLTTLGLIQTKAAGRAFGWNYKEVHDIGHQVSKKNPSPQLVYFRSSGIERTLQSAESFSSGYFAGSGVGKPMQKSVNGSVFTADGVYPPIYSVSDKADAILRGWEYCPSHQEAVAKLFASSEFVAKEKETHDFRVKHIAPILKLTEEDVALSNWHKVYARIMDDYYDNASKISAHDIKKAGSFASWVERRRYGFGEHFKSQTPGGRLAHRIIRLFRDISQNGADAQPKIHVYAAHYATMLSVASAMELGFYDEIPPFASAVTFDLYRRTDADGVDSWEVSASYHSRGDANAWSSGQYLVRRLLALKDGITTECKGAQKSTCPLDRYFELDSYKLFSSNQGWCEACGQATSAAPGSILCGHVNPLDVSEYVPGGQRTGAEYHTVKPWTGNSSGADPTSFGMNDIWVFVIGWMLGIVSLCLFFVPWKRYLQKGVAKVEKTGLLSPTAATSARVQPAMYQSASSLETGEFGTSVVGKSSPLAGGNKKGYQSFEESGV